MKAVARLDVVDLTMEEPDLEEMVLAYYGTDLYGDGPRRRRGHPEGAKR